MLRFGLYELHDFFCPEEQEFEEEIKAGEHLDYSGTWTNLNEI